MRKSTKKNRIDIVVIGCSAGGLKALHQLLPPIPGTFGLALIVVQHRSNDSDDYLSTSLNKACHLKVKEAEDCEEILPGTVYIAPANYHLMVEKDRTFSLSTGVPENYSRPSIDVLFNSAARAFSNRVAGIILTGANRDGSAGVKTIKEAGGLVVVQEPKTAEVPFMPQSAINTTEVDHLLSLSEICTFLQELDSN